MGVLSAALVPIAAGMTVAEVVGDLVTYGVRVALKLERLLDEVIGLAAELRTSLPVITSSIESVSRSAENLHTITPVILDLPSTQQDVRIAIATLENLVGLANLGIDQLEAIPGARLVRRRISKALNEQRIG